MTVTLLTAGAVGGAGHGTALPEDLPLTGGAEAQNWARSVDGPDLYPQMTVERDVRVPMSDGITLRADVYRPADAGGRAIDAELPVVFVFTPYSKLGHYLGDIAANLPVIAPMLRELVATVDLSGTPLEGIDALTDALNSGAIESASVNRDLVQNGYVQVLVDVRGTGASQGRMDSFSEREQQDTAEVLSWAAAQPWSNGLAGMVGTSYLATNTFQAAGNAIPGLAAVFDVYGADQLSRRFATNGGTLSNGYVPAYKVGAAGGRLIPPLADLLTTGLDLQWLRDRLGDAATPLIDYLQLALLGDPINEGATWADRSSTPEQATAATFIYASWNDIFDRAGPAFYNGMTVPTAKRKLMMDQAFHINAGVGLGKPGTPPRLNVLQRAWFDRWLKDLDNGIDRYPTVTLNSFGAGWVAADQYPRAGSEYQQLYLSAQPSGTAAHAVADGSLTPNPGVTPGRFTVAPGLRALCSLADAQATGGAGSVFGPGCTRDNRFAEGEAATFTTDPVTEPTVLSGPMAVHLTTITDAPEGYWGITVTDVAPDGRSQKIAAGAVLSSERAVDDSRSGKSGNGVYTTPYLLGIETPPTPVVPGQPTVLDIPIDNTDAVLAPGHRLRVDVFGLQHDRYLPSARAALATELRPEHIELDPTAPSWINVPVSGGGWR
ncbi:CocE/NonD family hydrolase [Nocardia sp. NPDC051756]|uniref:CocE/NonD family hydrolase n=1 Tax=Nocardia sp. NPDC051756 TaxID=3154751 RepID=UPI00342F79FD